MVGVGSSSDGGSIAPREIETRRDNRQWVESQGNLFGAAVGSPGDVDGDSVPDLLVGAPGEYVNATRVGALILLSGKSGSVLYKKYGAGDGNELGRYFEIGPDWNGDGAAEVLVMNTSAGASNAEKSVLVLSGKTGQELLRSQSNAAAYGFPACWIADLDGDGRPDLAVARRKENKVESKSEQDYIDLVSSSGGVLAQFDITKTVLDGVIVGLDAGDAVAGYSSLLAVAIASDKDGRIALVSLPSGRTLRVEDTTLRPRGVRMVDDLDGGGSRDLAIPVGGETGAVVVMSSENGRELVRSRPPQSGDGSGEFGKPLIAVPDLDGDGIREIAIADSDSAWFGRVWIASARSGVALRELKSDQDFFNDTPFGESVARIPDYDGDAVADIAVGAVAMNAPSLIGEVYLFSGATGARIAKFTADGLCR